METQPQLLLLQKTMLVAEGTARPPGPRGQYVDFSSGRLIEAWMRANLGPEAKVRDVVQNLTDAIERLPDMIGDVEKTSRMISDGKVQLHPDTIRALRGEDGPSRRPAQVLWLIALGLLAIFVITLID